MPIPQLSTKIVTILLFSSILILSNALNITANAADIDQNGAADLQKTFSALLDEKKAEATSYGNTLETSGDLTVEPKGSYYTVTLPTLKLVKADGTKGIIAPISMNALPTANPDLWNMSVALPSSIPFKDAEDNTVMTLDIGSQRIGGIWDIKNKRFAKFVGRFENIALNSIVYKNIYKVSQMEINSAPGTSEKTSMIPSSKVTMSDLSITDTAGKTFFSLASANMDIDVFFNPAAKASIMEKLKADGRPFRMDQGLFTILSNMGDKAKINASIKNLTIINPPGVPAQRYTLKSADLTYNMNKHHSALIDGVLDINYSDLDSSQSNHRYQEILPKNFKGHINLANLPLATMLAEIAKTAPADPANGVDFRLALLQSFLKFPALFAQANTNMTLSDTVFGNDIYNTTAAAEVKTNPQALLGITGEGAAKTTGFAEAIAALEKRATTIEGNEKIKLLRGIEALKYLESTSKDEGSKKVTTIIMNEQMQILVNGIDLFQLIGRFTNMAPENAKK